MPAPLSFEQRQRIFVLWRQGLQSSVVAQRLHLAPRSVRRLCRAFDRKGEAALLPRLSASAPGDADASHPTSSALARTTSHLGSALFAHKAAVRPPRAQRSSKCTYIATLVSPS
jgi:Homeodomain-like domain